MITIGQTASSVQDEGGVGFDGYAFGEIAADYCGWQGPTINICSRDPGAASHFFSQQVPDANIVQVLPGGNGYDEDVSIILPSP